MWFPAPRILGKTTSSDSEDFLARNGARLLQMQIDFAGGTTNPIRTFSFRDLQEATCNFDRSRLVDSKVYYLGILDGCRVVIKPARIPSHLISEEDLVVEQITEIVILSHFRHKNIAKLLGCCLETRVPLLVYEFIPGGNLRRNMEFWRQKGDEIPPLSTRLRIAMDVADALSYLHCSASRPVVHKTVNPMSIVLGEDYTAKLVGFSYSVPIPLGKTHVEERILHGAFGYLCPEYATTGMVTEKVDVYAFGRILLDLVIVVRIDEYDEDSFIDGLWKLVDKDMERSQDCYDADGMNVEGGPTEEHPAMEECLTKLVADARALAGGAHEKKKQLRAVIQLALSCYRSSVGERPTMKEVVRELKRIGSLVLP